MNNFKIGDIVKSNQQYAYFNDKVAKVEKISSSHCHLKWLNCRVFDRQLPTYWHKNNLILVKSFDSTIVCKKPK